MLCIIEYDNVRTARVSQVTIHLHFADCLMAFSDHLLAPSGSRDDAFDILKGCLFLVEAKCQSFEQILVSYIPEAISQAIALLKSTKYVSTIYLNLIIFFQSS